MTLVVCLLAIDAYSLNRGFQDQLNNHVPELDDKKNNLPQNAWLKNFNPLAYQAILPLPYFHIGSENLCRLAPDHQIVHDSYIVSLKTGLPIMGVSSARASLSQTAKMVPLVLDPVQPIPVMEDIKDKRPLLLVVREKQLDEFERHIVSLAKFVAGSDSNQYKLYSLDPALLKTLHVQRYEQVKNNYDTAKHFPAGIFTSTDSSATFVYRSYDETKTKPSYRGSGAFQAKINDNNHIFDSTLAVPGNYLCSFWVNHIDGDVYPRLVIEAFAKDTSGKVQPYYFLTNVSIRVKAIDGHWGQVEFLLNVPVANAHVQITTWNNEMKKDQLFELDEFMIRPAGTDFYLLKGDTIIRNTRVYYPHK